jgi:hypothetical protein
VGKKFLFIFLILGISSIVAQSLLIRELMIGFYGNEFFVEMVLAFWLVWVAVGSLSAGKISNKFKNQLLLLFLSQILFSFFLFFEIILIRYLKGQFFGVEIPNLIHSFLGASLVPFPICFCWVFGGLLQQRFSLKLRKEFLQSILLIFLSVWVSFLVEFSLVLF